MKSKLDSSRKTGINISVHHSQGFLYSVENRPLKFQNVCHSKKITDNVNVAKFIFIMCILWSNFGGWKTRTDIFSLSLLATFLFLGSYVQIHITVAWKGKTSWKQSEILLTRNILMHIASSCVLYLRLSCRDVLSLLVILLWSYYLISVSLTTNQ